MMGSLVVVTGGSACYRDFLPIRTRVEVYHTIVAAPESTIPRQKALPVGTHPRIPPPPAVLVSSRRRPQRLTHSPWPDTNRFPSVPLSPSGCRNGPGGFLLFSPSLIFSSSNPSRTPTCKSR